MSTSWKAGVASTVITPSEPLWLAGWAVRTEPARGTLSELSAKALVIQDRDGRHFVWLTVDLIAISREISECVAREVEQRWGLPREQLLLCASHTHSGPEIRPDKVPFFHIPQEFAEKIVLYRSWLIPRLIAVIGEAINAMRPARLSSHETTAPFATNRRGSARVDHDVPVLKVASGAGDLIAVVFGYACHNLTLPPDDGRYSGDYAGFAQAALERAIPGATALFVAGAGADQNPEPRGTIELARQHGEALATAVHRCLATRGTKITGRLRAAYEEIPLGFQPIPELSRLQADAASDDLPRRTKAAFLLKKLERGESFAPSYPCPLQVAALGDSLYFIAIGGEPVIDYAHELKRRYAAPGRMVWVAGYANDMFGYVPSAQVLREGGYEGNRSLLWSALPGHFGEDTEQRLVGFIDRLVQSLEKR